MSIVPFLMRIAEVIVNPLITFGFTVALAVFFWGIFQFVANADNEDARKTGKRTMVWGIVGFLVMFGAFGIIRIVMATFGITLTRFPF